VILVDVARVSVSRPGKPLFDDLSLTVSDSDRLGVVGLNGCGKSTLLRVLAGVAEPEAGAVRRGRGVRVGWLEQEPVLPVGRVLESVGDGGWEAEEVLTRLGMGELLGTPTDRLSGGQRKRTALARVLVAPSDLLVLDEPTNHLDLDATAWLEDRLAAFGGGLVLVTHDRHVLDRVTTRVVEIDRGRSFVHEGGYGAYLEARADREEKAEQAEGVRRNLARTELAWLRRGAPARTRKSKARITSATAIIEGRPEAPARAGALDLGFGTPRLGSKVIELHGVGFAHPGSPPLFSGLDLLLDKGERLGIVGPNGAGKTTLLDLLASRRNPTVGRIEVGPTVRLGYHDQLGVTLDPTQKVRDAVAGPTRVAGWEDDRLLERFWFGADARHAPIGLLSGGERRRLQLVLVLAAKPNVLLLDEPTNDLDLDTLRTLEDFLETWPGALVVVSHDRAFLERTIDEVLAVDGLGGARMVAGGYAAWEEARRARRGRQAGAASRGDTRVRPTREKRSPSTLHRLLKQSEKDMLRLQRRADALTTALADAATDHVKLARVSAELAETQQALEAKETNWLELNEEADG